MPAWPCIEHKVKINPQILFLMFCRNYSVTSRRDCVMYETIIQSMVG